MANPQDERYAVYEIPINIFDGPSAFGLPARNWIEAAILALIPALLIWNLIPVQDIGIKLILIIVFCLPVGILALVGYNGESLSQFFKTYMNFRRSRRVMEYQFEKQEDVPQDELDKRLKELERKLKDAGSKEEKKGIQNEIKEVKAAQKERDKKRRQRPRRKMPRCASGWRKSRRSRLPMPMSLPRRRSSAA